MPPIDEPITVQGGAPGTPTIRVFQGQAADSFLAATARDWAKLGDTRLSDRMRATRERLAIVRDSAARARPRPDGFSAILDPEPDDGLDGSTTSPEGTYGPQIFNSPELTIDLRDDVAIITVTALIRGTHLHADMTISATNQSGGTVVPRTPVTREVQNTQGIGACIAHIPGGCLVGTVRITTEIRGLPRCGVKVEAYGVAYAFNSSYSITFTLAGIISVSPKDVGQGNRILIPLKYGESPRCTPPAVHIKVRGKREVSEGGTLYDTVPAGTQAQLILDGTSTTPGNTRNVSYEWFADGVKISEYIATSHFPYAGRHSYEFRVRNEAGLEGRASATVVVVDKPDSIIKRETSGTGGGDESGSGSGDPMICYDWYVYYYDTGQTYWVGESCGNEPPPSAIYMTSPISSSGGALSFSINGGAPPSRSVTMVLTDDVPAGSGEGGALYTSPGSADDPFLLIPSTATPKDIAAALELARRSLEYPVRANTLVRLKSFSAGERWLGERLPAAGKLLTELRSAPVKGLGSLGSHRAITVPIVP